MIKKGIILSGGTGSRLYPLTKYTSKQLIHIYDKPIIYYSLSVLMLAGIRDILIICDKININTFKKLFKNFDQLGLKISFCIQDEPNGIAEAFILGEKFINQSPVSLILGDNFFYAQNFSSILSESIKLNSGALIYGYRVKNPESFGVVEFDSENKVQSIEEKPKHPKSDFVIPGLYFFDEKVVKFAKKIRPSKRGELEITSVLNEYLKLKKLNINQLGRGMAWLDTGTFENLLKASNFVEAIQNRQGFKIACPEEISINKHWISKTLFQEYLKSIPDSEYKTYLMSL